MTELQALKEAVKLLNAKMTEWKHAAQDKKQHWADALKTITEMIEREDAAAAATPMEGGSMSELDALRIVFSASGHTLLGTSGASSDLAYPPLLKEARTHVAQLIGNVAGAEASPAQAVAAAMEVLQRNGRYVTDWIDREWIEVRMAEEDYEPGPGQLDAACAYVANKCGGSGNDPEDCLEEWMDANPAAIAIDCTEGE